MTSQGFAIKSQSQAPSGAAFLGGLLRRIVAAHRRRNAEKAVRLWLVQERGARDCGFDSADIDAFRLGDSQASALGHLGFATMLFQPRGCGDAVRDVQRFRA